MLQLRASSCTGDMVRGWMQSAALSVERRYSTYAQMIRWKCTQSKMDVNNRVKLLVSLQVSVLCHLFDESPQSKEVLGEITDYNKRYSGAPRRVGALPVLQTQIYTPLSDSLSSPFCLVLFQVSRGDTFTALNVKLH